MPSLNQCNFMGNVTRDPELRYTPSNTAVATFSLAINRRYTDGQGELKEEVTFLDCAAFGKSAETIERYVRKGDPLFVSGRIRQEQWEDRDSGQRRSKLSLVVEMFQFLKGREPDEGGGNSGRDEARRSGGPVQRRPSSGPNGHTASRASRVGNAVADNRPAQAPRAPAEAPFPDENQFKDDDIPF